MIHKDNNSGVMGQEGSRDFTAILQTFLPFFPFYSRTLCKYCVINAGRKHTGGKRFCWMS